jgi:hypothetical protein
VGQRRQLGLADLRGEADDREVRAVDLEQQPVRSPIARS